MYHIYWHSSMEFIIH